MKLFDSSLVSPRVDNIEVERLLKTRRTLSDLQISELLKTIKPVVRFKGQLYYIEPVDSRRYAFTWSTNFTGKAEGLTEFMRISTLHNFSFYGTFKPTIDEVLAMIPQEVLGRVKAFETIGPKETSDFDRQYAAIDAGYHAALTVLYE